VRVRVRVRVRGMCGGRCGGRCDGGVRSVVFLQICERGGNIVSG
jgi:hypothetical protein